MKKHVGLGLLALMILGGCESQPSAPAKTVVSAVELKPEVTQTAARFSATVKPRQSVDLSFKVPGTIEKLFRVTEHSQVRNVQEGDRLDQGIVIAQLETRDYKLAVATAQAGLEQARASVRQAEASLGQAEAQQKAREEDYAFSKLDADRMRTLALADAVAKRAKDLAESQRDVAAANVKAAAQQVAAAKQLLQAAQQQERAAQVGLETSEDRLADCFLKVPFDGATVVAKKTEPGERVAAYQSVFTVMDVTQVHVEFRVPDILLGDESHRAFSPKIATGNVLDVFVEALDWEKFQGRVTKIAPAADPATRTFLVEVTLNNPPETGQPAGRLRPGMIVSIRVGDEREAMLLPLTAIQSGARADEFCVYVLDNDIAHQRRVVLGGIFNNRVEILPESELKSGERVIVAGANRVSDNKVVRILE